MDDAARRRALRRIARRHHPDVGGDLQTYLEAVAALEREAGRGAGPAGRVVVRVRRPTRWRAILRRLRRALRSLRAARRDRRRARAEERLRARRAARSRR